jgi:hypothetical protein
MQAVRIARLGLALLALAAGCTDRDLATAPADPAASSRAVSDGAHGGTRGFYFLAPLVGNPAHDGAFDAGASPMVEVCALRDCSTLLASFTMDDGSGSEAVRLDREREHYIVNWHTDRTGAEAGSTYRVRVRVGNVVLGHVDVRIAGNGRDARNVDTDQAIALVDGRTLPIRFRIERDIAPAAWSVGSAGGTISAADGSLTLDFPAGALVGETVITIEPTADAVGDAGIVPGLVFRFGPSGTTFQEPVALTVAYDPASLPAGIGEGDLRILKLVAGQWVQIDGSTVDGATRTVSATLGSFSVYGVGVRRDSPFTLNAGRAFSFTAGRTSLEREAEFYLASAADRFWANNQGMRGLVDLGVTTGPLEEVSIPASGYDTQGVAIVVGRTYVTPINAFHDQPDSYGVLRVIDHVPGVSVTFEWVVVTVSPYGSFALNAQRAFSFTTGTTAFDRDAEFYLTSAADRFWANNEGMRGLVDLGVTTGRLEDTPIPASGYDQHGVAIVVGHTYVTRMNATKGMPDSYGILRVTDHLPGVSVTFDWVIVP